MTSITRSFTVLAVALGLTACTAPRTPDQISQVSIDYRCGPGGQTPLTVQYTFQGEEPLAARVIYQNQVVELPRSTAKHADMAGNTFRSDSYTWLTQTFDYDNVGSARGEMLTREVVPSVTNNTGSAGSTVLPSDSAVVPVQGPAAEVSNIIVRDCVPVASPVS